MTFLWTVAAALAAAAAAYVGAVAYMYARQRALLYHPSGLRPLLAQHELPRMREVTVRTSDGLDLLSWYAPPKASVGRVMLMLHGNAGTLDERAEKIRPFLDVGLGVFALAWRGYSGNQGQPSEAGLYLDAAAGLARLADLGHRAEDSILYGESLGSAIATHVASRTSVAALILEAPPLSIVKMGQWRYPWLPVDKLLKDRFETDLRIGQVRCPILIMHGCNDKVVPFEMGRRLAELADGRAEFAIFDDGAHTDLHQHGAADRVLGFLRTQGLLEQS